MRRSFGVFGFLVALGLVFGSAYSEPQWYHVPEAESLAGDSIVFLAIDFLDSTHGVMGGKGVEYAHPIALLYENGVWKKDTFAPYIDGISYRSSDYILAVSWLGNIWKRENDFWKKIFGDARYGWLDIGFFDENYGIAVGFKPMVETHDNGRTWDTLSSERSAPFDTLEILNPHSGYCYSLCIVDSLHAWIGGSTYSIFATKDGGKTFELQYIDPSTAGQWFTTLRDIDFCDTLNGWAVGDGRMYKTNDGGKNWQRVNTLPTGAYYFPAVKVISSDTIWCSGSAGRGHIWQSTDGGKTWTVKWTQEPDPDPYYIKPVDWYWFSSKEAWAVGQGLVLHYYEKTGIRESDDYETQNTKYKITVWPNPASGIVNLEYGIWNLESGKVSLRVYDMTGRLVRTLVDKEQSAGDYMIKWNGRDDFGKELPNGVYFLKFKAGTKTKTQKLILLR